MEEKKDYIYDVALSPNFLADGICFAARETGLYRSKDQGKTWQNAFESLNTGEHISALAVAVSPNFAQDGVVYAGSTGIMLKSKDQGASWSALKIDSPLPLVSCLLLSPNYQKDISVYVGTLDDGVYVSNSAGLGYTGWNFGLLDRHVYALAAADGMVFAGVESGIFRSTNGGRFWQEVSFPMTLSAVNALVCDNRGTMFAGTEEDGLYCSEDAGQHWDRIAEQFFSGAVNYLTRSKNCDCLLAATDDAVYLSVDDGLSWQERWRVTEGFGIASLGVLDSFDSDSPLLVGLASGKLQLIP